MSAPARPGYPEDREKRLLELARRAGTRRPLAGGTPTEEELGIPTGTPGSESWEDGPEYPRPATMAKNQAAAEVQTEATDTPQAVVDPWEQMRAERAARGGGGAIVVPGGMRPGFQQTEQELGVPVAKETKEAFDRAQALGQEALQLEEKIAGDLSRQKGEVERRIGQENELFRADEMGRKTTQEKVLNQHRASLDAMRKDVREHKIDPERVAHQRGWLYNLAGRILGAIGKERMGDPNPYIQRLNAEIERDNAEQVRQANARERDVTRNENLYNVMRETFKNDDDAARALHILKLEALQAEMRRIAATSGSEQAKLAGIKGNAMLEMAKSQQYNEWSRQLSGKAVRTVKDVYEGPKVYGAGGGGSQELVHPEFGPEPTPEQVKGYGEDYFKHGLAANDVVLEQLAGALGGSEYADAAARHIATGNYGAVVAMIGKGLESDPKRTVAYAHAARELYKERGAALTELEDRKVQQQLGLGTTEGVKAAIAIMARSGEVKRRLLNSSHGQNVATRFYTRQRNQAHVPVEYSEPSSPKTPTGDPPASDTPKMQRGGASSGSTVSGGIDKLRRAREAEEARGRGKKAR